MTADPFVRSLHQYVSHSLDATLLCYRSPAGGHFIVDFINPPALAVLGLSVLPSLPVPVEILLPDKTLPATLAAVFDSQSPATGQLWVPAATQPDKQFDYEIVAFVSCLAIRLTAPTVRLEQAIGRHSMAATLMSVLVFEAVRTPEGGILDFRLIYRNNVTDEYHYENGRAEVGKLLTDLNPETKTSGLFHAFVRVVETGTPFQTEQPYDNLHQVFQLAVSRFEDGIILSIYNSTGKHKALEQAQQQVRLVEQILDSTVNPIYLAEAIRDGQGEIIDFLIARCNDAGRQNMLRTIGRDGTGERLLSLYPFAKERGLFAAYVAVVETGAGFDTEQYYAYNHIQDWQLVSARKAADGIVVTYTNITESRRIRQQVEEQAAFLNRVLDSSINGIMAFTAVRDEAGVIHDFIFISVNAAACQIAGLPLQDMLGQRLLTVFPVMWSRG